MFESNIGQLHLLWLPQRKIHGCKMALSICVQGFLFASAIGHSPTKYLYVRTQWCKQDKMSWIKKMIFPYCFEIDSETVLQYNSISPLISHSAIYILGGPIASFIPQVYNYVRNMYSWFSTTCTVWLYQYNNILSSISLPERLCTYNVATD